MRRIPDLFDRMTSFATLCHAARLAARRKRNRPDVAGFLLRIEPEVLQLQDELRGGTYRPSPFTTFTIKDPKERLICAAPFRDRVVHHALCDTFEPFLDKQLIEDSYACRKDKGTHAALARCKQFAADGGWFLKCDVAKYYDSVDHGLLLRQLRQRFKGRRLLELFAVILAHQPPGALPGKGLPIGNFTSQHFANLYLDGLDRLVKQRLRIRRYLRYMDDFVLFSSDPDELRRARRLIVQYLADERALALKERATLLSPVRRGVPVLGFSVYPRLVRVRRPNLRRSVRRLRFRVRQHISGKIPPEVFAQSVRSILEHLSHGHTRGLRLRVLSDQGVIA